MATWNANLIQKSGPMVEEEGYKTIYEYEFLCLTSVLADSKPNKGELCPDDEAATCTRVFTQPVSPTHSRIEATFKKGFTISFGGGLDDGDEWDEGDTIEDAEENTEGDTVRKTRPIRVDHWIKSDTKFTDSDKQSLDTHHNKTNKNGFLGQPAGRWRLSNIAYEPFGTDSDKRWHIKTAYELNDSGWDSTDYPQDTVNFPIRV